MLIDACRAFLERGITLLSQVVMPGDKVYSSLDYMPKGILLHEAY